MRWIFCQTAIGATFIALASIAAADTVNDKMKAWTSFQDGKASYEQQQYAQAFSDFLRAAKRGLPEAQMSVGYQYETGQGVMPNPGQAKRWYLAAFTQRLPAAAAKLGTLYQEGKLVRQNAVIANAFMRVFRTWAPGETGEALVKVTAEALDDDKKALAERLADKMLAHPSDVSSILERASRVGTPIF